MCTVSKRKHAKTHGEKRTRGGSVAAGTTAPVGMHLLLNGEFLSPPSVYSLFLLSSLHPHGHLKFTYDKQTESVSLSVSLSLSRSLLFLYLGYAYPPLSYIVASRVQRDTYPYFQREYYSFQFVHALGKRAVPPVCRHVNLQLARTSTEGGGGSAGSGEGNREREICAGGNEG